MKWKRSISSYPLWGCMLIVGLAGLILSTINASYAFGADAVVGLVITFVLIIVAGCSTYFLHLYKRTHPDEEQYPAWLFAVTAIVLLCSMACGVAMALMSLSGEVLTSPYFDVAKVRNGCRAPYFIHGATNTYVAFLNKLFFFFGNRIQVALYAQVMLWILIVICLGIGVWFAVSRKSSVLVMLMAALLPALRAEAMNLSPVLLYGLMWSAVFAWICFSLNCKHQRIVIGINCFLIGLCIYFDLSGALLGVLYLTLLHKRRIKKEEQLATKELFIKFGIGFLCLVAGFMVCICWDSSISEKEILPILQVWGQTYSVQFNFGKELFLPVTSLEYIPVYFLICIGAFAFWRDRRQDLFKGWMLQLLVIFLTMVCGLFSERIPGTIYVTFMLLVLSGVGLESVLSVVQDEPVMEIVEDLPKAKAKEDPKPVNAQNQSNEKEEFQFQELEDELNSVLKDENTDDFVKKEDKPETTKTDMEEPVQEIKFLENPLPLPKKHEKKTIDFPISSDQEDDFDYEVDEDDDYDIP